MSEANRRVTGYYALRMRKYRERKALLQTPLAETPIQSSQHPLLPINPIPLEDPKSLLKKALQLDYKSWPMGHMFTNKPCS